MCCYRVDIVPRFLLYVRCKIIQRFRIQDSYLCWTHAPNVYIWIFISYTIFFSLLCAAHFISMCNKNTYLFSALLHTSETYICTWMAFYSTLSLFLFRRGIASSVMCVCVCVCARVNCDTNRNIDVLLLLLWYVIIARYCYCYYLLFHIGYWHCDTDDTLSFTHEFRSFCCWIWI